MSDSSAPPSSPTLSLADDRLDSWKEIAAYLKRDVTTVQRWEKREAMPIHRHLHDKAGSVYALRSELDAWAYARSAPPDARTADRRDALSAGSPIAGTATADSSAHPALASRERRRGALWLWVMAAAVAAVAVAVLWALDRRDAFWTNPIARARFARLTGTDGTEQAAAVSRDGRFVAFLSDRDGPVDVWVTQVGTGQFYNLSRNASWELVNPSVRTLGFSPDGALVTFWTRKPGEQSSAIGIWAVPILGGPPRPYLEGAAEFDWSADGSRLVYHTPGPGDPMLVTDAGRTVEPATIFTAAAGLHSHFPVWSPDQAFIYFVQGSLPDRMDIWRIGPAGGSPERITQHQSRVSHPVFLNARTLVYLAADASGGPWIYSMDVVKRIPHRVSSGVDTYTSLAGSAESGRLVATLATTKTTFWRVPNAGVPSAPSAAARIALTTGNGVSPRLGPDSLVYVVPEGSGDSVWKQQGQASTRLWTAPDARLEGAPAIDADGRRIAFVARQRGRAALYVVNADGTDARVVGGALDWQGTPAWAPDGRTLAAAALEDGVPRLYGISPDGGAPRRLSPEHALDPAWSPDGRFIVFSGADIGTTFPLKAVDVDGSPHPLPELSLTRGTRHLRFLPGGRWLVFVKGEIRHKNLWAIDLETGAGRQLTDLAADFDLRDFDVSADGREMVLERAQAHSQIVLLDLPRR
jgi:Tol biopolymer transport system component